LSTLAIKGINGKQYTLTVTYFLVVPPLLLLHFTCQSLQQIITKLSLRDKCKLLLFYISISSHFSNQYSNYYNGIFFEKIIIMELIERVWSHFFVLFLSHIFIIIEHDQGALDCFVAD